MNNEQSLVDPFRIDNRPAIPGAKIRRAAVKPLQHRCLRVSLLLTAFLFVESGQALFAAPPPNDNFANRITLTTGVTAVTDTTGATVEPGEPNPRGSDHPASHTVWYTWTASSDSMVFIDDIGSDIRDNFVAVFMGSSLNTLVYVALDAFFLGTGEVRLSFPVKAGTTLQIDAGSTGNSVGPLHLTLTTTPFNHVGTLFGPDEPNSHFPDRKSVV